MPDEAPAPVAPDAALPGVHKRRACVVTLGGQPFAVDVGEAREVVMLETLTPVPGAPPALLGVANLRGSVLGVVEARPLLGLPAGRVGPGTPTLVLAAGDLQAAIPLDRVLGLDWFDEPLPLPADDRRPGSAFATGLVPHAGAQAMLLDAGRLLEALRAPWAPAAAEA